VAVLADLEASGIVYPKLFRRLAEFFTEMPGAGLDQFAAWLEATDEQVQDLTTTNFTHFDNVVAVQGQSVKMTQLPEQLVFISRK
jgi:hypothetical protein